MAAPFINLGLKATNKVIDDHFHKIPDKYFHPHTYIPGKSPPPRVYGKKDNDSDDGQEEDTTDSEVVSQTFVEPAPERRRSGKGKRRSRVREQDSTPRVTELDNEDEGKQIQEYNYEGIPRNSGESPVQNYTMSGATNDGFPQQYDIPPPNVPLYSQDPPRMRPQYVPSPPPAVPGQSYYPYSAGAGAAAGTYFPPPPTEPISESSGRRNRHRHRRDSYNGSDADSDPDSGYEDYYSDARRSHSRRRPEAITRRSSSYHGPRDRNDYNNSYGTGSVSGSRYSRRGSDAIGMRDRAKDTAHRYGLKQEVSDVLSTSKQGLAGGAVGAVIGGWVANKAQVAYGKDHKKKNGGHEPNPILTLLGAAVGGLAVDAIVNQYEISKGKAADEQAKLDSKSGKKGEKRRGSGSGSGSQSGSENEKGSGDESPGGRRGSEVGSVRSRRSERGRRRKSSYDSD